MTGDCSTINRLMRESVIQEQRIRYLARRLDLAVAKLEDISTMGCDHKPWWDEGNEINECPCCAAKEALRQIKEA